MPLTLYSVTEARAKLEEITGHPYTRQAVNKAIASGRLAAHRIGEVNVICEEALIQYVRKWGRRRSK